MSFGNAPEPSVRVTDRPAVRAQERATVTSTDVTPTTIPPEASQVVPRSASATTAPSSADNPTLHSIRTVFLIVMENHNWSSIEGSPSARYINTSLLPMASHAEQYFNPPHLHPSLPNYLWLEAGRDFGVRNDNDPTANHQSTSKHLVTLLEQAHISWKSYQEGIDGSTCPLKRSELYVPKHNPMLYFDDVTDTNNPRAAVCISHVRPMTELSRDLEQNTVARYNFVTPNLCNDMHNAHDCESRDNTKNGDQWLSRAVPQILASRAYRDGGALFITWDEGEGGDGPIGMIVLSPYAKGGGYANNIHYTHSSTLRTVQEIFGVKPLLGAAADAPDLGDLFRSSP